MSVESQDLMREMNSLGLFFPADWIGKEVCKSWHAKLTTMRAADNMDDDDVRQLQMELTNAKTDFHVRIEAL